MKDGFSFFKYVASLFALEEGTQLVAGTPEEPQSLVAMILQSAEELNAFSFLRTIGIATKELGHINRGKMSGYYLIINNLEQGGDLTVKFFPGMIKQLVDATYEYDSIEAVEDVNRTDAVLVSAESYENLVYAYPNYFSDVTAFLSNLERLLAKYKPERMVYSNSTGEG